MHLGTEISDTKKNSNTVYRASTAKSIYRTMLPMCWITFTDTIPRKSLYHAVYLCSKNRYREHLSTFERASLIPRCPPRTGFFFYLGVGSKLKADKIYSWIYLWNANEMIKHEYRRWKPRYSGCAHLFKFQVKIRTIGIRICAGLFFVGLGSAYILAPTTGTHTYCFIMSKISVWRKGAGGVRSWDVQKGKMSLGHTLMKLRGYVPTRLCWVLFGRDENQTPISITFEE